MDVLVPAPGRVPRTNGDAEAGVHRYAQAWELIGDTALDPAASRKLIDATLDAL